jgi:hypothetical protein
MASRRAILGLGLFAVLGVTVLTHVHAAEQPPAPSEDLLEYLGNFEEANQDWSDFIAAAAAERDPPARTDAPAAKAKADK